jgi:hypothetical protein
VKLFGVQWKKGTTKQLQFLEFMKALFHCGGNTKQQSISGCEVSRKKFAGPKKDDFLKFMMQSSFCSSRDARLE